MDLKESIKTIILGEFFASEGQIKPNIIYQDVNFDNIKDIGIYSSAASGSKNEVRTYYLFDPKIEQFRLSKSLSGLANITIDKERRSISSFWAAGHASMVHGGTEHKLVGFDSLIELTRVRQDFNDSINAYIRKERIFLENGKSEISYDTLKKNEDGIYD